MADFTFNENQVVDTIDKVPEEFRGLYKETDGKFKLDSENPIVNTFVSTHSKLSKALEAERKMTKKGPDLSGLKDYGSTVEEIAANVAKKIEEASTGADKDAQKNLEKIKATLAEAHTKALGEKDTTIQGLTGQLYTLLVENSATAAISEHKGVPELLMPFIKNQIKVITVDGKQIPRVVDAQGDIRYSGATGEPMTIGELVKEMKANEKFARLFESDAPSGGGTRPGSASNKTGATTNPVKTSAEKSSVDKISAGLSRMSQQRR